LAAKQLREQLFTTAAGTGLRSTVLVESAAAEDAEDFVVELVNPQDTLLGGADAVLMRNLRQVLVRNDVGSAERAFLIAHELGHWKLHPEDPDSCHRVIDFSLNPADGDSFGAQKVEAYGARERAELQANTFAREFLLPRDVARMLFLAGKTAKELQAELDLPLELVRQQLLDGLLLPEPQLPSEQPEEPIVPTPEQVSAATSTERTSLV
jgi:Zn-dependent peptidase ImmA (M78 family)